MKTTLQIIKKKKKRYVIAIKGNESNYKKNDKKFFNYTIFCCNRKTGLCINNNI